MRVFVSVPIFTIYRQLPVIITQVKYDYQLPVTNYNCLWVQMFAADVKYLLLISFRIIIIINNQQIMRSQLSSVHCFQMAL